MVHTPSEYLRAVVAAVNNRNSNLGYSEWPLRFRTAIEDDSPLGYAWKQHDSMSRHVLWVFLLHNGARPDITLKWLHTSGRVKADALHELINTLKHLYNGTYVNETTSVTRPYGMVKASLHSTVETRHVVDDAVEKATAYAAANGGARCKEAGALNCEPHAAARVAYFNKCYPWRNVCRVLHRNESPIHLREVTIGKDTPLLRSRPCLSLSLVQWATTKRHTSLHVGPSHDGATQIPRDGSGSTSLGTEICLEIDDLPRPLEVSVDDVRRWCWLKNAVSLVTDVLRRSCGVAHMLMFASGNRGPHIWLLDSFVLEQSTAARLAFFDALRRPMDQAWWPEVKVRCLDFYENALCRSADDGGFGLQETTPPRTTADRVELVWPRFDEAVVLGRSHLHRMPFSLHEKTMRVAIPFAGIDTMPTCTEDAPHVTDPELESKLAKPLAALCAVIDGLASSGLLGAESALDAARAPVPTSPWVLRKEKNATTTTPASRPPRKRKLHAAGEHVPMAPTDVHLEPLRLDTEALTAWRAELDEAVQSSDADSFVRSADIASLVAKKLNGDDARSACRSRVLGEIKMLDSLIEKQITQLTNVVGDREAGGRLTVYHPEIKRHNFVKAVASITRHRITGHRLLELDIVAAHPSVAWGALLAKHGPQEARRLCPNLGLVVTDRLQAFDRVIEQYGGTIQSSHAKRLVLQSMNQSHTDPNHDKRKHFLKQLVEERPRMEAALCDFPPLGSIVGTIQAKAAASGKQATLLSLLFQAAENVVIVHSIPALAKKGWVAVGEVNDALLLQARDAQAVTPEEARDTMMYVGSDMGIPLAVKIDHAPLHYSPCSTPLAPLHSST